MTQVRSVAGKDALHRMNYLYQASRVATNVSIKTENVALQKCSDFISNYYINVMINTAKKSVLRIDTEIKRNICKGCRSVLILGETAMVRLRKKPFRHIRWTCLKCFTARIFKARKDYKVWSEKPEAVVELLEYKNENNEVQLMENS